MALLVRKQVFCPRYALVKRQGLRRLGCPDVYHRRLQQRHFAQPAHDTTEDVFKTDKKVLKNLRPQPRLLKSAKGYAYLNLASPNFSAPVISYTGSRALFSPRPFQIAHQPRPQIRVESGQLEFQGREGLYKAVDGRWLRDHCSCSECRNHGTAQRKINVLNPQVQCTIKNAVEEEDGSIKIVFADGHETMLNSDFLANKYLMAAHSLRNGYVDQEFWDANKISRHPREVVYDDVENGHGLGKALRNVRSHGFCLITGMPATPEASEALLRKIGPIRNTHYGGFYDFTSDLSSKDTAYTAEALEPHTDNTYFTEPAGLQALHMLSHTDGTGGESSLVDGFACAAELFNKSPSHYLTLSTVGVYAHASGNEGISIQPSMPYPTFTHDSRLGHLTQVRWNNADRAGVDATIGPLKKWYDAAAKYDALLNNPKYQYWFQLKPGTMLLFDNWRVLHGRAAFTGKRRMCGGYINRDDWISKFKMTNFSEEEIRMSTVTG